MIQIFIDSSVLFSAALSAQGGSRELILMAVRNEVRLVVSEYVLPETQGNIANKAPSAAEIMQFLLSQVPFEIVKPTTRQVVSAAKHVELKDAPIVAAAKKAKADLLVTLDKKHLLGKPEVAAFASMPVVTPRRSGGIYQENLNVYIVYRQLDT